MPMFPPPLPVTVVEAANVEPRRDFDDVARAIRRFLDDDRSRSGPHSALVPSALATSALGPSSLSAVPGFTIQHPKSATRVLVWVTADAVFFERVAVPGMPSSSSTADIDQRSTGRFRVPLPTLAVTRRD